MTLQLATTRRWRDIRSFEIDYLLGGMLPPGIRIVLGLAIMALHFAVGCGLASEWLCDFFGPEILQSGEEDILTNGVALVLFPALWVSLWMTGSFPPK